MSKKLSVKEAISFGWNSFKEKPKFWILVFLIISFSSGATPGMQNAFDDEAQNTEINTQSVIMNDTNVVENGRPYDQNMEVFDNNQKLLQEVKEQNEPSFAESNPVLFALIVAFGMTLGIIIFIVSAIVSNFINMGAVRLALDHVRGNPRRYETLLSMVSVKKSVKTLSASFLFGFGVFLGFLLLIIPGIYLVTKYGYFLYGIVDKDLGIKDSFKYSAELTKGVRMQVLKFQFVSLLLMVGGVFLLLVGAFFAWIVVFLAGAYTYEKLREQTEQGLVEAQAAPAVSSN